MVFLRIGAPMWTSSSYLLNEAELAAKGPVLKVELGKKPHEYERLHMRLVSIGRADSRRHSFTALPWSCVLEAV